MGFRSQPLRSLRPLPSFAPAQTTGPTGNKYYFGAPTHLAAQTNSTDQMTNSSL